MHLTPCSACRRHIRACEPRCPFCSAPRPFLRRAPSPLGPLLARAAAVGGSAALACASPAPAPPAAPAPSASESPAPAPESSLARPAQSSFSPLTPAPEPSLGPPPPVSRLVPIYGSSSLQIVQQIHFEAGSDKLRPESTPILLSVADILDRYPALRVAIHGHTDANEAGGEKLSQRRADAVRKALVERGVDPARMVTRAHGATQPLVPNDTKINRALNRRAQFEIIDTR